MAADPATNGSSPAGEPVGPYRTLDTSIRRRAALVYAAMAVGAAGLVLWADISAMWMAVVVPLLAMAVIQFVAGWKMKVTDMDAIAIASEAASFDVGHASGSLGFRGPLAKPVWQVLAYGAGPTPTQQAVIAVDALTGEIRGLYEERVEPA